MAVAATPGIPRFEHHSALERVLGVGTATPRVSWSVAHAPSGYSQTAYELEITRRGRRSSYVVQGAEQVLVAWPDTALESREAAAVRVRVAHGDHWSDWSPEAYVETGLLDVDCWTARFISPIGVDQAPRLTGTMDVPGDVASARLYATAHGVYVPSLNGTRVSDDVLAPGWTSYHHRLRYQTYDVTDLVVRGRNTLEVLLGNGWFRGRLGYEGDRAIYGDRLALLAQLEVTTTDGIVHVLATDGTWAVRESEIVADDLYDGQVTDLRRVAEPGRCAVGGVEVVDADLTRLVAPEGPPVRKTQTLPARRVFLSPSGRTLIDFGQNAVGWVRLRVRGVEAGTAVVVRHAEVLEDGELSTRPLRAANATDSYILGGPDDVVLEPQLTFHGFRYAEVDGVPDLRPDDIEAVVVGSDLTRTGWFSSSHALLNRLHENVVWSMRGNFFDVPTDCPQRDERLGWTGDIQVFAATAMFLFDSAGFLSSWLADLAAEQLPDGSVPHVVPGFTDAPESARPAAGWGDAAAFVPWTLYVRTGDVTILARQYASMRAWVDKVASLAGPDRVWSGGFQFGDWLDPTAPPEAPGRAKADPDVVATAHLARSADIVGRTAALLGFAEDAQKYGTLAQEAREAFGHRFVTPAGRVLSDAQTVYALAIEWALLPEPHQRDEAGRRLADLVRAGGFRIATGFLGTPLICDALSTAGYPEVAYRLLLQTQCPSWLYPVTMGATTIWERWDSMRPDGSINPGEMTSFNHYALGAVADWLHRAVAGLAPAAPGYREIVVRPLPTAALTSASARHITPYGEASVRWARARGRLKLDVRVPVGATAWVHVPGESAELVGHGEHSWDVVDPVSERSESSSISTVRDLLDEPATWALVTEAAIAAGLISDDAEAATRLAAHLDSPAVVVGTALAPDMRHPGAEQLRRRASELLNPLTALIH